MARIAARIREDLIELRKAVNGEFRIPVAYGLEEMLNVLDDLIADVVDLLGELAVAQLGGDLLHRRLPPVFFLDRG